MRSQAHGGKRVADKLHRTIYEYNTMGDGSIKRAPDGTRLWYTFGKQDGEVELSDCWGRGPTPLIDSPACPHCGAREALRDCRLGSFLCMRCGLCGVEASEWIA